MNWLSQYEVQIDLKKVQSGSLYDDWDMIPPRKIKDPKAFKPDVSILIYWMSFFPVCRSS